jgi:transposase
VVRLRDVNGMTVRTIASTVGLSTERVRRLLRALDKQTVTTTLLAGVPGVKPVLGETNEQAIVEHIDTQRNLHGRDSMKLVRKHIQTNLGLRVGRHWHVFV